MTTASATNRTAALDVRELAVVALGAVLLLVSLVGPTWLVMPSPDGGAAVPVSFADLVVATDGSPSTIQATFFGWCAWVLFGVLIALSIGVLLTSNRALAVGAALGAAIVAVVATLALKGPQTWAQTIESLPNLRLGGYLMLLGLVALLAYNVAKAVVSRPAEY